MGKIEVCGNIIKAGNKTSERGSQGSGGIGGYLILQKNWD